MFSTIRPSGCEPDTYPTHKELEDFARFKHAPLEKAGWAAPSFRIFRRLVSKDSVWLDVGGGRDLFPSNLRAGRMLSNRCELLVGVDPSDNILENTFVHRGVKSL